MLSSQICHCKHGPFHTRRPAALCHVVRPPVLFRSQQATQLSSRQVAQRKVRRCTAQTSDTVAAEEPEGFDSSAEAVPAPRDDDVEVLLPEFWDPGSGPIFAEEGDQQRFWKLTRRFMENLAQGTGSSSIKAVYPDMGVAAMLKNQWPEVAFKFASLSDRKPVSEEDELVVLAAPDPQSLEAVKKATYAAETVCPIVLFNPRLASGDVGVGLNVRRLTKQFLSTFTTSYSLRPIADLGSVFKRYPGMWQVFLEDPKSEPGRYILAAERPSRPAGDELDAIVEEALGLQQEADGKSSGKGMLSSIGSTIASLQKFSRSLSR